jgi:opacity protein-like surface antigen
VACAALLVASLVACSAGAQEPQRAVVRGMTVELGGGLAYTEFNAGPGWPNATGFYGSLGVNVTHWLQVYADGDKQFAWISDGNTRLYGDHLGARYYYRPRDWMLNPFAETLFGISRLDLNLTHAGQKYSENGFSFRVGGGLDLNIDHHWAIRAFEADYYRTPFLQTHQNNLWVSAGVVFKFGEREYP